MINCRFPVWIRDCVSNAREQGMSDSEIMHGLASALQEVSIHFLAQQDPKENESKLKNKKGAM